MIISLLGVAFQCHIDANVVRKHDGSYDGVTSIES
jgi:hypothetical protein